MGEGDVTVAPFTPDADKPGVTVVEPHHNNIQIVPDENNQPAQNANDAALHKADQGTDNNKLLAGKYKTKEELIKGFVAASEVKFGNLENAYNKLAGDLTPVDPNAPAAPASEPIAEPNASPNESNVQPSDMNITPQENIPTDLQPHMDDFAREYTQDGKLSDNSYGILEKAGYDKDTVDTYMRGVAATQNDLFGIVGGQDAFKEMTEWAGESMNDQDIAYFNQEINSNDMSRMKGAMNFLQTRFQTAGMKTAPKSRVEPTTNTNANNVKGYTHLDQLKADQRDPRYKTDASFRAMVADKIRNGTI
jgi:hypothetical protein